MKRGLMMICASAALACSPAAQKAPEPAAAPGAATAPTPVSVAQWTCEDGRTIAMAYFAEPEDHVELTFGDGRKLSLPAAMAASGNLFEADGVRFHTKGMTEAYFAEGEAVTNCTSPAEPQ